MRPPEDESSIEWPLALLLLILVLAPVIFFGMRHYVRVQAAEKREEVYQSTLRSYREVLKAGMQEKKSRNIFGRRKLSSPDWSRTT
jgi:hypothetical protein